MSGFEIFNLAQYHQTFTKLNRTNFVYKAPVIETIWTNRMLIAVELLLVIFTSSINILVLYLLVLLAIYLQINSYPRFTTWYYFSIGYNNLITKSVLSIVLKLCIKLCYKLCFKLCFNLYFNLCFNLCFNSMFQFMFQ